MPIFCGARPRFMRWQSGMSSEMTHLHGVVVGVGIPVTAASVDRHDGHRRQRAAIDDEGHGLIRSHATQRVGVVAAFAVQHDNQWQGSAGLRSRGPGDGVANGTPAGL